MSPLYSLRTELEFSTQTQHGKKYVVVKDPVTLRYFRFSESQAVILELVGSPVDIETLATTVSERFGTNVKRSSLEGLLDSLDQKLLLDTPATQAKLDEYRGRKTRERDGNLLYMRLVSVNAEAVFEWLYPKVRWCFTPAFNIFAVLMIICGFVITFQARGRLGAQFLSLLSVNGILTVWIVVYFVTGMHEFAHGLTCRYSAAGARAGLHADLLHARPILRRQRRLDVSREEAARLGDVCRRILSTGRLGMATVVWRVVAEDTLISSIALSAILFGGVQTLINFNPLIKLDGYYMLSDYLEIPNLRAKAFQAVQARIAGQAEPLLMGAHRRALLLYGGCH